MQYLSELLRASEMVGWFRRHYPDVKEQSLRAHIQLATSNASAESRVTFVNRQPLITRIGQGLYRRFDGDPEPIQSNQIATRDRVRTRRAREVDIEATVGRYLRDRYPSARYTSFEILSAMRTWAIAGYAIATAAECCGLVLILIELHDSRRVLREWLEANPNKNEAGSWGQIMLTNKVVLGLLGSTCRRITAAVLVTLGITAGAAGNFLSLPSA